LAAFYTTRLPRAILWLRRQLQRNSVKEDHFFGVVEGQLAFLQAKAASLEPGAGNLEPEKRGREPHGSRLLWFNRLAYC
jgi:hypothetical protein